MCLFYLNSLGDPEEIVDTPAVVPPNIIVGTVFEGDLPPRTAHPASASTTKRDDKMVAVSRKKREERKLAIMMMSKKRKRLLEQIMKSQRKKRTEVRDLKRKRDEHEERKLDIITKRVKVVG